MESANDKEALFHNFGSLQNWSSFMFRMLRHLSVYVAVSVILSTTALVISEEELDQFTAPAPKPTVPGLQPPRSPQPPQRSLFPKIPGLSNSHFLGELLSGRTGRTSEGQKRLFKRDLTADEIISDHEKRQTFGKLYIVFPLQSPGWPWRLSQGPPRLGKGSKIPPQ